MQKSILIVENDKDLVRFLTARCKELGLRVKTASSLLAAVFLMDDEMPDLICVDIDIRTSNGLSFCEVLSIDPESAKIPVIVLARQNDDAERHRCNQMCAYYIFKSNYSWDTIKSVICELIDIFPENPSFRKGRACEDSKRNPT